MKITAFNLAQRFVGIEEVVGPVSNPAILMMLKLDADWPQDDEVAWCSAFMNYIAWLLRLPRSKSLRARSWLRVGVPIPLEEARAGFDLVVLKRGPDPQPGPDVIDAPGHVGWYAGVHEDRILLLGGNQSDTVRVSGYAKSRLLGVRRLHGVIDG